jgi:hypothetical protein
MGTRPKGDAMGEVQRVLYVQSGLPPTQSENDCLPGRHDSLRMFRICWNGRVVRFDTSYS